MRSIIFFYWIIFPFLSQRITAFSTQILISARPTRRDDVSILYSTTTASQAPPALTLENLSCSHNGGETWQLKDVSYVLPRSARVALVGRNGCGKSTLMKILAENACRDDDHAQEFRYTGQVVTPRDVRVAYVEQEPSLSSTLTVADALLGIRDEEDDVIGQQTSRSVFVAVRRYQMAMAKAVEDPDAFSEACAKMDDLDGWSVLTKADEVATKLRVNHLQDQVLSTLSGGERKRVALAAALVQEPDVLLLDEPTNMLSLAGVQYLTDLLVQRDSKMTILFVSHDRFFLDEVCDRILELDQGSLYEYMGKYADYLTAKEERLALEDAAVQSAKAKYRVELDWMRRQPQARESKSKARIGAFYKLEKATKPRPRDQTVSLGTSQEGARRMGGKILSLRDVSLKFGDRVMLDSFSYDFLPGDRICLSGANGVGKTTFVRILAGELEPDAGVVDIGDTMVLGVYEQQGLSTLTEQDDITVLQFVLERVQSTRDGSVMAEAPDEARRLLKQFAFPRQRWTQRVSMLSGGERRRLQMLAVLTRKPNLLIMDEPSVDCDLDTLQALEQYLQSFAGVLILVSHDRYFADKVTDHLFVFEGDGVIKDFSGSLSEYATTLVEIENEKISEAAGTASNNGDESATGKKEDYKESKMERNAQRNFLRQAKKDMLRLEKNIEKLKKEAKTVQEQIDDTSSQEGWSVLAELTEKLNRIEEEMETQELEWMEIAEQLEGMEALEI